MEGIAAKDDVPPIDVPFRKGVVLPDYEKRSES